MIAGERVLSVRRLRGGGTTLHGLGQPGPDISALFSERGSVASDRQKDLVSSRDPEASGDLLADLDHPEVLFRLVVRERSARAEEKSQNLPAVILQTPEKVLGGSGLSPFSVGSPPWAPRFLPSPIEEGVEEIQTGSVQVIGGPDVFLFHEGPGLQQEGSDRLRPGMMVVLFDGGQFSQEMGVAEGVFSRVSQVGAPEVVDHGSPGPVHHSQGFDSLLASFGMEAVEDNLSGGGQMDPMESCVYPESCLVGMRERSPDQETGHMVPEGGEMSRERLAGFQRGGFARHGAKEVGAELPDPVERKGLLLVQVGQGGLEPETIYGSERQPLPGRMA